MALTIGDGTATKNGRAPSSGVSALLLAVVAFAVSAVPAVIVSGLAEPFLPFSGDHRHAAYIATIGALWAAFAFAIVVLIVVTGRVDRRISRLDVALAVAAIITLWAWIFSIYVWNISKYGHVELEPVGPTTRIWPLLVIFAVTLLPLVRIRSRVALAILAVAFLLLSADALPGLVGAIRDGSISSWGIVVGVLYMLELVILAVAWARTSRASIGRDS